MQKEEVRRYWIFQGMPERYDLADKLIPDEIESWTLPRYHSEVKPGDVVYFWRGGRQSGLYGWGVVPDMPYQGQSNSKRIDNPEWWVNVRYQIRFENPIRKDELTAGSQATKLAGLLILRAPQGTNFKVTTNEAISLNLLIKEHSEISPEDPIGTDLSHFPVKSLAPLNFSRSVTLFIGAGLRLAQGTKLEQLDGEMLLTVLLALAVSSQGPSRGTVPFLEKFFSGMNVKEEYLKALDSPVLAPKSAVGFFISDETLDILESARLLAIYSTRKEDISVRHFLAGLLLAGKDRTLARFAETASSVGISLRDLVQQFIEHTVSAFERDDRSLWMSQFRSGASERLDALEKSRIEKAAKAKISPALGEQADIASGSEVDEVVQPETSDADKEAADRALTVAFSGRPVPDRPFGADLLRIESEVDAMAHLFALCDEDAAENGNSDRSTFALGLFGRWGSGKSFFIEKLKKKITDLSESDSGSEPLYCREIIQIDFNAWHYNEANIWASLVHHIFDTLQKHFQELQKEEEFKNLIRKLEISQERREQLNRLIGEKLSRKKDIEDNISKQEEKINSIIEEQMNRISNLPERIALNKAARDKLLGLLPQVADVLDLPTEDMRKHLEQGKQNASEIITILRESGAMVGRSQVIGKTILRSGLSKIFIGSAGVVLIIYFALPVWLKKPELWNQLLPTIGQVIALATPVLIWLRDRLTKASNLFNEIAGVEATLREDLRTEQEQKNSALITLRAEQERVSSEVADAIQKKELLDQEILDFKSKLDDLGSAESLIDYINDRAASGDYRSQLGILALIRRDFEKLSNLMMGSDQRRRIQTNTSSPDTQLPHIDRIILYIDDLDRVQDSKKVLQVLEAVHLLLAFPLFHVVVAVDERWAARSVLSHHGDFFGIKEVVNNSTEEIVRQEKAILLDLIGVQPATPREFLEKIFQISFWVRPLTQQLTEDLIEGVVTKNTQRSVQHVADLGDSIQTDEDEEVSTSQSIDNAANLEEDIVPENTLLKENIQQTEINSQTEPKVEEGPHAPVVSQYSQADEEDRVVSSQIIFEITNEELISMRALASVVGRSPRTVKRFINIYRLFKAMNIPPGEGAWTEEESDENRIIEHHVPIMILLSIQVGHPDIAVRLFQYTDKALSEDDNQTFGSLIDDWKNDPPKSEAEKNKWLKALDALSSVHDLYGETPLLKDLTIGALNPWLLATSRFGFQEWVPRAELLV